MTPFPPCRELAPRLLPALADGLWCIRAVKPGPPVRGVMSVVFARTAVGWEEEWPRRVERGDVRCMSTRQLDLREFRGRSIGYRS